MTSVLVTTTPTLPCLKNAAGMIPTFALPGESAPGQFGPSRRDLERSSRALTRTQSAIDPPRPGNKYITGYWAEPVEYPCGR